MQQLTETVQVLQTSVSSMAKLIQDLIVKQNKEEENTLKKGLGNASVAAATVVSDTASGAVAKSSSNEVNNVATVMNEIAKGSNGVANMNLPDASFNFCNFFADYRVREIHRKAQVDAESAYRKAQVDAESAERLRQQESDKMTIEMLQRICCNK